MFDEKNVYIRQAEIKGSFKQNSNGTFLIGELTVNSSLKNYEKVLGKAFEITMKQLNIQNENNILKKEIKEKPNKTTKTNAKM